MKTLTLTFTFTELIGVTLTAEIGAFSPQNFSRG
jgi:hypothetical protein